MAICRLATAIQTTLATAILAAIDAGSGPALLDIYNGTIPATPATAVTTQTKLGTLTFSDPAGTVTSGVLTLSAITQDSSADDAGTASWARLKDASGTVVGDFDITSTGGGGSIQMNTTNIALAGPILISSFTFSIG